jgi:uncharacterized protein (DUF983 family)
LWFAKIPAAFGMSLIGGLIAIAVMHPDLWRQHGSWVHRWVLVPLFGLTCLMILEL